MPTPPWTNALVTGASSGLGRGLTVWLARRGVRVFAAARREEALRVLRAEAGELVSPLALDVGDAPACFARIQTLDRECGGLDLVVANAGVGERTAVKQLDFAAENRMIQVNVAGASATLLAAVPGMIERRRGHLAGVSSLAGLAPFPASSTYCASKAYLKMFLDALRLDVARHGVAVTAILPGYVKSEMTAGNDPRRMPFLLETGDAVERMGEALLRRDAQVHFPWQMTLAARAIGALPTGLWQRLAGRGRR
jgi:short-subunit dehydrogenase